MKSIRLLSLLLALLLCIGLSACGASERSVRPVPIHTEAGTPAAPVPLASLHAEKEIPGMTQQAAEDRAGTGESESAIPIPAASPAETAAPTEEQQRSLPTNPEPADETIPDAEQETVYVINTNTRKFHLPSCSSVKEIQKSNREDRSCTAGELIRQGYQPCKRCNPAAAVVEEKGNTVPGRSTPAPTEPKDPSGSQVSYVVNTNTHKFHKPSCSSVRDIKQSNRLDYTGSREELIAEGYEPCKRCNP